MILNYNFKLILQCKVLYLVCWIFSATHSPALHGFCFIFFSEDSFPRLGSMIVEYENPLKKIAEQFVPHQQVRLFICTKHILESHNTVFYVK